LPSRKNRRRDRLAALLLVRGRRRRRWSTRLTRPFSGFIRRACQRFTRRGDSARSRATAARSQHIAEPLPPRRPDLSIAEGVGWARLAARISPRALSSPRSGRLRTYAVRGVAAWPHVREGGRVAIRASSLQRARQPVVHARRLPGRPNSSPRPVAVQLLLDGARRARERVALSAELRTRGATSALGAEIHFYASSQYNSMLTLVGVIPYADASLVFAVNHTFTEQVTGIGSSVRHSIARNLVATQLAGQLEETRNRLNR
jgi:hypothetical protein